MNINVMNEAYLAMGQLHNEKQEVVMIGVAKLKDGNAKSSAARTELTYLNGVLGALDPSNKDAKGTLSANFYQFMVKNNLTVDGKSAAVFFNNGNTLSFNAVDLTKIVGAVENYTQSINSESQTETQMLNMALNAMNAALSEMSVVARGFDKAWQTVTSG